MKICHVITRMILGGAQENTLLTCERLAARGHDVTLVTGPALGPEGQLMDRVRAGGYHVVELDDLRREIHPLRDWRAGVQLEELLADLAPDVLHTHSSKAGILARRAAGRVGGAKVVHTIHGLAFHPYQAWWLNRLYVTLERRAAKGTDAFISVADAMTAQMQAAGVGRGKPFVTIYSGMEVAPFLSRPGGADAFRRQLGLPEGTVLVTQVSRLAPLKGHEYLLAAAAGVRNPNVRFCFVGDGTWRERIARAVRARRLEGRVHLTGLLPPEQMPAVMHATDILVHCSLREGLARTLPQAMLAGRPVVSFDVDGAREVVNDRTGVLLSPKDVAGLIGAIEALSSDPARRAAMGQAGRESCRERFDHEFMTDRIEEVYRRLL